MLVLMVVELIYILGGKQDGEHSGVGFVWVANIFATRDKFVNEFMLFFGVGIRFDVSRFVHPITIIEIITGSRNLN